MSYTNFQIGEKFPLPIRQQGEGGLFQVDVNGAMFILQLAKSDIIAIEAFRTGEMELALCEEDGILFLLYRIPGIFKEGWGDAPLSFGSLAAEQRPSEKSMHASRSCSPRGRQRCPPPSLRSFAAMYRRPPKRRFRPLPSPRACRLSGSA